MSTFGSGLLQIQQRIVVRENLDPGSKNKIAEFSQSKHDSVGLTLYRGSFRLSGSKLAASKGYGFLHALLIPLYETATHRYSTGIY